MILVDYRSGAEKPGSNSVDKLVEYINRIGVPCEKNSLEFGDAAFEGNGPRGRIMIGVERKTLHDALHCIDDGRISGKQRIGMLQMYEKSFLMLEGAWKPHDPDGTLMEGFNGMSWGQCRYRSQRVMYSKLYRYLLSLSLSGVIVTYSRDLWHTAFNICEIYHYFQKPWDQHTSMLQTQQLAIPSLTGKPSVTRGWATWLTGVGVKLSIDAEKLFRKPRVLANANVEDWQKLHGIGRRTAEQIVKEIIGA